MTQSVGVTDVYRFNTIGITIETDVHDDSYEMFFNICRFVLKRKGRISKSAINHQILIIPFFYTLMYV